MIADGRECLQSAWWIATVLGVGLGLTIVGINYFGDGLRQLMDPRLRTAS
jgi:peptide/nickel transport system permease protein